jgi:hypothetical protein
MSLYHLVEYMIVLITGIFDNLALLTAECFHIKLDKMNISLSRESGKRFLEKVKMINPILKQHIDTFRDFINLVYTFREKVSHQEGLSQLYSPIAHNWSSFIKIDPEIWDYIKRCGDGYSEYKYISKWGVLKRESDIILDPYFFSSHVLSNLILFTNEYFQKLWCTIQIAMMVIHGLVAII